MFAGNICSNSIFSTVDAALKGYNRVGSSNRIRISSPKMNKAVFAIRKLNGKKRCMTMPLCIKGDQNFTPC